MASRVGRIDLPFTGGFYASRSRQLSAQECVNWYPNYSENDALNPSNLYPTPGISEVFQKSDGGFCRGALVMNEVPYFVCQNSFFRINRTIDMSGNEVLTKEVLGAIPGSGRVRMASNKSELVIVVPGESAYVFSENGVVTEITNPNFDGPVDDVVQVDSVFVFCKTGTNKVFHSDLNQATEYNALDFTLVNQMPVVRGLIVYRNQLHVMGESATVPFANVGGTEFLFQVMPSSVIDSGLAVSHAKSNTRGSFAYLGGGQNEELAVWAYAGGAPQKISTDTIDYILQNYSKDDVSRAYMFRHSQNGAEFLVLCIADRALVYDATASQKAGIHIWHERRSQISYGTDIFDTESDFIERRWRVSSLVQAYNRIFVSDIIDDRIGLLDDAVFDEYGTHINRRVVTQPFINAGARTRVMALEIYMDTGINAGDRIAMSWSDDGGYNYCERLFRSPGSPGEYGRRVIWNRLGSFANTRILKIEFSGKSPCSINKIMANTL